MSLQSSSSDDEEFIDESPFFSVGPVSDDSFNPRIQRIITKREFVLREMYHKMELNEQQKRDFHVLLIRLGTVSDLINISKKTFNDIKDIICCPDKRCLCDPNQHFRSTNAKPISSNFYTAKQSFGKSMEDFEYAKLHELKKDEEEMSKIHTKLCKLREIVQHEDEDLNNFSSTLEMYKDLAYHKSLLTLLGDKLRRTIY